MLCTFDEKKKYLRKELNEIAKACKIKYITKFNKEELEKEIKKVILQNKPKNTTIPKNEKEDCIIEFLNKCKITSLETRKQILDIINKNKNVVIPNDMKEYSFKKNNNNNVSSSGYEKNNFIAFCKYFEDDLLGFTKTQKPKLRAFVPGGYGLMMLLENKYNTKGKIKTGDLDITVSINNTTSNVIEAYNYLLAKCKKFIELRANPSDFKINIVRLPTTYNPILKMRRYYVISIYYKNDEFVDLCLTDREINKEEIDLECSNKSLLPIKKDDGYFKEYFQIIYMENVPGVDSYCYLKRNPVTGKFSCKGMKDIDRINILCQLSKNKSFQKYCKLTNELTVDKLKAMSKEKRDKLFISLRELI